MTVTGVRRCAALLAVLIAAPLVISGTPARASTPTPPPAALVAGQRLVAGTSHDVLSSPSSEFQLELSPDMVTLLQYAPLHGPSYAATVGADIWYRDDSSGKYQSNTDHSTLTMQTNGDLTLRTSGGHVLWATHTKGTGAHNRLVMRDDGDMVMYTNTGHIVWSSWTTGTLLPAGRTLRAGAYLRMSWQDQFGPRCELIMQRSGDLQYLCGRLLRWHSATHVPNSYLSLRTDGNLAIYSPKNTFVWTSHTAGRGPYTWLDAQYMTLSTYEPDRVYWCAARTLCGGM